MREKKNHIPFIKDKSQDIDKVLEIKGLNQVADSYCQENATNEYLFSYPGETVLISKETPGDSVTMQRHGRHDKNCSDKTSRVAAERWSYNMPIKMSRIRQTPTLSCNGKNITSMAMDCVHSLVRIPLLDLKIRNTNSKKQILQNQYYNIARALVLSKSY